jgi:hypothetical protein
MGALQAHAPGKSGGLALNASHFADPAQRAALFDGLMRDIVGASVAKREQSLRTALESAFMAGAALVRSDPSFDPRGGFSNLPAMIHVGDLPLDAQDGFALMTEVVGLGIPGSHPHKDPEPLVLRPFHTSDAKQSWWAELPEMAMQPRWTPWVIAALERFGLLVDMPNNPGRSTLTHRAVVLMQNGSVSRDIPVTAAWERNPKARGHTTADLK